MAVRKAWVALAAISIVVAGCGSSSQHSSSTSAVGATSGTTASAAGNTASAPGVTATTVKIGLITSVTGASSSTFGDTAQGAQARFDVQNANGGVNGRKLDLVVGDDASSAGGVPTAAEELIEGKQVFGVLGIWQFLFAAAKILHDQNVPTTGPGSTGGAVWGQQPYTNMFAFTGGQDPHAPATTVDGQFLKSVGAHNVGVFAYGISPGSVSSIKQEITSDKTAGLSVGYQNFSVPIGGVDFTASVLAMKPLHLDAVVGSFTESTDLALTTAIKQGSLPVKSQLYFTGYDQHLLDQPTAVQAADGDYFRSVWVPFEEHKAASEDLITALQKYDPSYKGGIPDLGLIDGWLSADLMIKGLSVAGANPTRSSFASGLSAVTDYDGGGLLPASVAFNHFGSYDPKQCSYFVQLQGSKFVPVPANGAPTCGTVIPGSNTA